MPRGAPPAQPQGHSSACCPTVLTGSAWAIQEVGWGRPSDPGGQVSSRPCYESQAWSRVSGAWQLSCHMVKDQGQKQENKCGWELEEGGESTSHEPHPG